MFKEKIKAELKKQGLPESLAKYIHVENETEIEGAVSELKGFTTPTTPNSLDEILKDEKLKTQFVAELQKEGDKRVTEALKTHKKKLEEEFDFVPKTGGKKPEKTDEQKSELEKQISALTELVTGLVKEKQTGTKKERILAKLKEKELSGDHGQYADLLLDSQDDQIDSKVEALKATELTLIKKQSDEWAQNNGRPPQGKPTDTTTDIVNRTKAIVESRKAQTGETPGIQKI
jgi:hypothetical protein